MVTIQIPRVGIAAPPTPSISVGSGGAPRTAAISNAADAIFRLQASALEQSTRDRERLQQDAEILQGKQDRVVAERLLGELKATANEAVRVIGESDLDSLDPDAVMDQFDEAVAQIGDAAPSDEVALLFELSSSELVPQLRQSLGATVLARRQQLMRSDAERTIREQTESVPFGELGMSAAGIAATVGRFIGSGVLDESEQDETIRTNVTALTKNTAIRALAEDPLAAIPIILGDALRGLVDEQTHEALRNQARQAAAGFGSGIDVDSLRRTMRMTETDQRLIEEAPENFDAVIQGKLAGGVAMIEQATEVAEALGPFAPSAKIAELELVLRTQAEELALLSQDRAIGQEILEGKRPHTGYGDPRVKAQVDLAARTLDAPLLRSPNVPIPEKAQRIRERVEAVGALPELHGQILTGMLWSGNAASMEVAARSIASLTALAGNPTKNAPVAGAVATGLSDDSLSLASEMALYLEANIPAQEAAQAALENHKARKKDPTPLMEQYAKGDYAAANRARLERSSAVSDVPGFDIFIDEPDFIPEQMYTEHEQLVSFFYRKSGNIDSARQAALGRLVGQNAWGITRYGPEPKWMRRAPEHTLSDNEIKILDANLSELGLDKERVSLVPLSDPLQPEASGSYFIYDATDPLLQFRGLFEITPEERAKFHMEQLTPKVEEEEKRRAERQRITAERLIFMEDEPPTSSGPVKLQLGRQERDRAILEQSRRERTALNEEERLRRAEEERKRIRRIEKEIERNTVPFRSGDRQNR